jgi:alkanesulfonate monooxygenase SsuD/methylene tetrahydromethanopterin reductase-like flavin-dependent oxidoreductase (luciferase family)
MHHGLTPGPPEPGKPGLPREYYAVADPFVSLAAAAAVTSRIKLATGICLVPQRDVFQLAKEVASLDLVSNGRFLFGVGGGWNRPALAGRPRARGLRGLDLLLPARPGRRRALPRRRRHPRAVPGALGRR